MRPHPSHHVEPSWLVNAQREHTRKVREAMPRKSGALRATADQEAMIRNVKRELAELKGSRDLGCRPGRPPGRSELVVKVIWSGLFAAMLLFWFAPRFTLGVLLGTLLVTVLLHVYSRRRAARQVVMAQQRAAQRAREHYHGDELCTCDQPNPCCDMGRVAYPFPCPWHPETATA